jgi:hypothetical protein
MGARLVITAIFTYFRSLQKNSMKGILAVALIFISSVSFSQSFTGKWKPVFFSMDTIMRADTRADTLYVAESAIEESFREDKDPEMSRNMMKMLFQALFKNIKEVEEEYLEDGNYRETNSRTKKTRTGKWTYSEKENTLVKTMAPMKEGQRFTVSWKDGLMVLTTEMESGSGKKGKLEIVYEKL